MWTRDPSSILRHPQHPSGFRLLLEKAEDPDELKIYVETLAFKPPGDVIIFLRVTGGWIYYRNIIGISRCGAPQFYINIYTWSLHYPSFLGSFAKHLFFGYVWYFLGSFHAKKAFYLPSRCWLYTLSITKLNHVSVLFLSCVMLDQAPSHIIQTQAHN